jgi:adenosylcobyric acid synthase
MLATTIVDAVESGRGRVPGLALLPTTVTFGESKHLALSSCSWRGDPVDAFQIHHGQTALNSDDARTPFVEPFLDGFQLDATWGTSSHGLFENDAFRRSWLAEVADQAGVRWQAAGDAPSFRSLRNDMLDRLADAVEQHLDTARMVELIDRGNVQVPFVPPGAP